MCTRHGSLYIFEDVFFYFLNKLFLPLTVLFLRDCEDCKVGIDAL